MIGSSKDKSILIFIGLGILFSLFVAIILKLFFEKISNINELSEATKIPVLGGVPFIQNLDKIIDLKIKSKENFAEALRVIRTSMNFLLEKDSNIDSQFKSFLISSIHPGEGKTFTTINLARIFASSGKKVLLVDFDMHKPKVHKELDIDNNIGNSTNLSLKSEFIDTINEIENNLHIITSGPVPPNPSELVLSKRVNDLFDFAKKKLRFSIY